ncbi:MAG: hypothetical protein AAEJ04_06575 [Planctomycetota bacterium]
MTRFGSNRSTSRGAGRWGSWKSNCSIELAVIADEAIRRTVARRKGS